MRSAPLFCLAFFTTAVTAAAFPAHVARCHDGDACTLDIGSGIRLAEIDAPELHQPYGTETRDVLCSRDVDIEPLGRSYDRIVGLIRVGDLDTSEAMVAAGPAWDHGRYDRDPAMPALEEKARAGRSGFWTGPAPILPWEWRYRLRPR